MMSNSLISIIESREAALPNNEDEDNDEKVCLPARLETSKQSIIGRVRTCSNITVIEWSFIIISAISIGVGIGLSIFRLLTVPANSDQFVFVILVLANIIFAAYYLFHGVFQEQPFEILMLILTTVLMWLLVTLNYVSEEKDTDEFKQIRFLISTLLSIPNVIVAAVVGWRYWSSGNLVFKTVGGEIKYQKMCRILFFGYSLLAFDAQAAISCIILILRNGVSGMSQDEMTIVISGGLFVVLWLAIGVISLRTENLRLTCLFAGASIVQPAYVVYLFVKGLETRGPYSIRTQSSFLAGAVCVLAHFSLLATIPTIAHNYGSGLKARIYGGSTQTRSPIQEYSSARIRNTNVIEPVTNLLRRSSEDTIPNDADMEPLIVPGSSRQNYHSTVTTQAIVTCP